MVTHLQIHCIFTLIPLLPRLSVGHVSGIRACYKTRRKIPAGPLLFHTVEKSVVRALSAHGLETPLSQSRTVGLHP